MKVRRTQQVSPGGQSVPAAVFHTLFTPIDGVSPADYEPEPIAKIFVTRFESRGPVQALRPFRPEELTDNAAIFARFGGGTYEIVARREDGTIYAKRLVTLEGEAKSMNGEPSAPQPSAAGAPGAPSMPAAPQLPVASSGTDTMLAYMMQTNMTMMTMLGNVMVAMVSGQKSDAAEQARAMGETMKATIDALKPSLAPPQQPPPQSTVSQVKEVLEIAKLVQAPPPPPPPPAKEETTGELIGAIAQGLSGFMALAAQGAQGAPPAGQLAQAATQVLAG